MECVVVSLGGSVLVPGDGDLAYLQELAARLRSLSGEFGLVLVCGGGRLARYYIFNGRKLGASRDRQDRLGIEITRLNARLVQLALGDAASPIIPTTIKRATQELAKGRIVVMGGTTPGHTTDAVTAMVAEAVKATRIVNATSVQAAYTADPKKYSDAKRLREISHKQLFDLVNKGLHSAGPSDVFDKKGAYIAMRTNIPLYIVHGRDLDDLINAVRGEKVKGTVVRN